MPGSVWDGDTTRPWQQADLCNDGLGSNLARCSHPSSLPSPPLPAPLPIRTLPSCCLHFLGACACWYQGGSLDGISFGGQARDSEDSGCGQPFVDGPLRWLYNASPCQRVSALAGGWGCGLPNGEKRCRVHMPVAAWVPPRPCSAAASAHTLPLRVPARPQDTLLTPPSSMGAFGIPTVSTSPACPSFADFAPDVILLILHVHTRGGSLGLATNPPRSPPGWHQPRRQGPPARPWSGSLSDAPSFMSMCIPEGAACGSSHHGVGLAHSDLRQDRPPAALWPREGGCGPGLSHLIAPRGPATPGAQTPLTG